MTIDVRCRVCKNADRRRLIELGWNGGMAAETISRSMDVKELTAAVIMRHLKEHAEGAPSQRDIDVKPELPARQRVLNLQRLQLDEVERRIELAKQRADRLNAEHENDADWTPVDWSDLYDILGKDAQAAISSILKTQGLTDKREKAQGDLKLGLFEAMANAGLAPKALVGETAQLPAGDDDD